LKSLNSLHLIAFDVPYPPNYGGVVDIYYKLKALHQLGLKIHLHCYEYGRGVQEELNNYCSSVNYYPRNKALYKWASRLPYIVNTRNGTLLLENLSKDNHPILFEGIHSCYYLPHPQLELRHKIVRTHNVEHDYYKSLAESESKFFNRLYFRLEASRLERYESVLSNAQGIAAISKGDENHFSKSFNNVKNIPAFHPFGQVIAREGASDYCLYHGNLQVAENNRAALHLIHEVFDKTGHKLIIAGSKPSAELISAAKGKANIEIRDNPDSDVILNLVAGAHINILPTFQATGIKLKLLAALFSGRHCLVNTPMIQETGLEPLCHIADRPEEMAQKVDSLMQKDFQSADIALRKDILEEDFSNQKNAEKLAAMLKLSIRQAVA
jgi:hypothetical protein